MKRFFRGFGRLAVLGIALCALGTVAAQAGNDGQAGRAVRLSDVEGQVTITLDGQQLSDHALANTPLFEGTQIVTGDDGRAEVEFENGAVARIPPDSSITLTVLRPGDTEIDMNSGEGYFELEGDTPDHPTRVRFGSNLVTASGFTVLRVQLDQAPGNLAVLSGNAHLEAPDNTAIDIHAGESIDLGQYSLAESIEPDSWDAWNSDRDQALTSAEANTTAATSSMPDSSNPAWSDLNQNGSWYNTPDGYVWSPYDASNSGWDPYGNGYWMNEPTYGNIWVSAYPWGYMPYQCGAWSYYSTFGWGWAPGGCSPWWGGAGGGLWAFNYGHYPNWYRPPFRPHAGPLPRTGPMGPHNPIPGHPVGSGPIIAVHRHSPSVGPALPPRDGNTPVSIGGSFAQPIHLTPVHQSFARLANPPRYSPGSHFANSSRPGFTASRPTYVRPPANAFQPGNHPNYIPFNQQPGARPGGNPRPAQSYHPPSGGGYRAPSGGGSHPSGGGGHPAGGGGHPAGGGGGHPR